MYVCMCINERNGSRDAEFSEIKLGLNPCVVCAWWIRVDTLYAAAVMHGARPCAGAGAGARPCAGAVSWEQALQALE